ncbi:MAG: hypothetical protein ACKPKO_13405, partial [Candidatus Fonsibacter sp.]
INMFQLLSLRIIELYSSAAEQPSSSNTPRMPHNPACPSNSRLFKPLKETLPKPVHCLSNSRLFKPVRAALSGRHRRRGLRERDLSVGEGEQ